MLLDHDEPTNYEEAMMTLDSAKWLEAMKSETWSMYENKSVDFGGSCTMIGKPYCINGSSRGRETLIVVLQSTKLDLSQKVFWQVQGVEYDEIFSLVSMLKSVWIMLAIATFYDYEIWQVDVKTAFLNGFIKEELYIMQPEGFVNPKGANKVCKLQWSIHGLVQASRRVNIRFDELIKAYSTDLRWSLYL